MFTAIQNFFQSLLRKIKGNELYYGLGLVLFLGVLWWIFQKPKSSVVPVPVGTGAMTGGGSDKQLVLYYADWCGHCKTFKPKWDEFAAKYDGAQVGDYKVSVTKVDCEAQPELAKGVDIQGYPTVVMYKDGEKIVYNGERTTAGLEQFLQQ